MYCLVEFVSTGDLGAVPSNWIQNAHGVCICYWPPRSVINAVRSCREPNPSTWTEHDVKVLGSFRTYKEARKAEQRRLDDLDGNTESDENLGRGKRKKIQKYLLDSFGDSLLAAQNKILKQSPVHDKIGVTGEDVNKRIIQNRDEANISLLTSSDSNGSCHQNAKEVRETMKSTPEDEMTESVPASNLSAAETMGIVEAEEKEEYETNIECRETVTFNESPRDLEEDSNVGSGVIGNPHIGRSWSESGLAGFRMLHEPSNVIAKEEADGIALEETDATQPESIIVGNKLYILKTKNILPTTDYSSPNGSMKEHHCCCNTKILEQLIEEVACLRREIRCQRTEVINPLSKPYHSPHLRLQQGLPVILPFQSVFDVEQFEEKLLLEQKKRKQLVENIVRVGGDNVGDVVKRVLQGLFTKEAASYYSWEGRKGKRELKGMMLMSLIVAALQTGYVLECADLSLATIKHHINQWFLSAGKTLMRKWREGNKRAAIDFAVQEPKMMKISEVRTEDYDNDVDIVETKIKIEEDYMDY